VTATEPYWVTGADLSSRPIHDPALTGLLALDIDGTLSGFYSEFSPAVAKAVGRAAAEERLHLVLATGRSAHSTLGMAERLGVRRGWAVCSNGSLTIEFDLASAKRFEIVDKVTFDPARALAEVLRLVPGARVAVEEIGHGFLVSQPFPAGELDGDVTVAPMDVLAARPATRVILRALDLDPEKLDVIMEATDLPGVNYSIGWTGWIDLNPPGVSKAAALEVLRQRFEVPPGGTVAVGDGGNDLEMLRWASRGVAMGGSSPKVLAAANEVTGTLDEDGVVQVIDSALAGLDST